MKNLRFVSIAAMVVAAGCTTNAQTPPPTSGGAMMDESVPQVARQACLREVARATNAPQGVILDMLYSEANSQITIGVGPDRAKWQCTVSKSGVVANVMSLTNEGAL